MGMKEGTEVYRSHEALWDIGVLNLVSDSKGPRMAAATGL